MDSRPRSKQFFISFKWKALLLLSLVLVAMIVSFYLLTSINLHSIYDRQRDIVHKNHIETFQTLIEQFSTRLQQEVDKIARLEGLSGPLSRQDGRAIQIAFEKHWAVFQLDEGFEWIGFFSRHNNQLATWGESHFQTTNGEEIHATIDKVNRTEKPSKMVICKYDCIQYVSVPILIENQAAGAVIVGVSLADVIIDFSHLAKDDVGIIAIPLDTVSMDMNHFLKPWSAYVPSLTHRPMTNRILQASAEQHTISSLEKKAAVVKLGPESYEVRLISLERFVQDGLGYLVTISDISDEIADIKNETRKTLLIGVTGLIFSEGALLLILWTPLSRLRTTASVLPLLAKNAYAQVRSSFVNVDRTLPDEIDQLDNAAFELSFQLEKLQSELEERNKTLQVNMGDLTRERDFVKNLLDTAQVLIVTHQQGKICQVNKFTERLTGYQNEHFIGMYVTDMITDSETELTRNLDDLQYNKLNSFRHEADLVCKDGSYRTIVWLHSRLERANDEAPLILAVGLDISENKKAEEKISWLANHDPLTGLYNRRYFGELFANILEYTVRYNRNGALLFLDLDHFKQINDTMGHSAGDALLKNISDILSNALRKSDIIARLGGDEFAVVIREVQPKQIAMIADKFNKKLRELSISYMGRKHVFSTSIGIALFPQHGDTVESLITNADLAMYRAKTKGRGSWHIYAEHDRVKEQFEEQVRWRDKITRALENDYFVLNFQPIRELKSGTILHYEALLRMRDSNGNLQLPTPFIQVAEQTGLINAIDHMVINKTIRYLSRTVKKGTRIKLALNLSAHAFSDTKLLPLLKKEIDRAQLDAGLLIFEITETAALADFSAACNLMNAIRQLGCRFALDDFGVGFSSFSYLKRLPVDYIKIDGSFIKNLSNNYDDQILVKAMTGIAKGFGKTTVAEWVEDEQTMTMLRGYGVDLVQGNYVGEPQSEIADCEAIN